MALLEAFFRVSSSMSLTLIQATHKSFTAFLGLIVMTIRSHRSNGPSTMCTCLLIYVEVFFRLLQTGGRKIQNILARICTACINRGGMWERYGSIFIRHKMFFVLKGFAGNWKAISRHSVAFALVNYLSYLSQLSLYA